ncbi:AAA family ATPase [Kordia sp. YSTF-M3]|uniref:AAA family ATPase n=1 Tax=Kordia aestuariivivens TaxID=2759037 RepID=A0ABR7QEA5_9FLAO|nr:AAA family ATPase [Kordia aestuariivivens]MBC8756902.1 AAA family ATPase [Kordia aestuariivivens]
MNETKKLRTILEEIKNVFVGKDEVIDLLGIGLLARENVFLLGPPGTAKSAIVKQLSSHVIGGINFDYLLTRFTEPNEIFGPLDIRLLKEGELVTNTDGMLPEASLVFLDEIFNANSAILNSLLMALNEKIFRRGKETKKIPALMFISASNLLPDDEALAALLDRFLIRLKVDNVKPDRLEEVLLAGWKLERNEQQEQTLISPDEVKVLQTKVKEVDLSPIRSSYIELIHSLRNTGIEVSDRRAVKMQNLVAASAMLCDRQEAILSDLWVLKYIWSTEEQIETLQATVNALIEKEETNERSHPQAFFNKAPNPEELMSEVTNLKTKFSNQEISLQELNVIKDKLRYLQNRTDWIKDQQKKQYINTEIDQLWKQILHKV